jgi:hypothetical protein
MTPRKVTYLLFPVCIPKLLGITLGICTFLALFSCSSGNDEKSNEKQENTPQQAATLDTSLRGLTGVIENNSPVQQGYYVAKYPNGIIKMKGYYVNGKRNGQWMSFYENGNLQSKGFFKDGLRDGKAEVYYENGKIYYEGYYKKGREVGWWTFYSPEGKIIMEKNYSEANP